MANRKTNLSKIDEEPEEDYETAVVKKQEGASVRSSFTTRPQTQAGKHIIVVKL